MHRSPTWYPAQAFDVDISSDMLVYQFNQWKENLPETLKNIGKVEKPNFNNMVLCLLIQDSLNFLGRDK